MEAGGVGKISMSAAPFGGVEERTGKAVFPDGLGKVFCEEVVLRNRRKRKVLAAGNFVGIEVNVTKVAFVFIRQVVKAAAAAVAVEVVMVFHGDSPLCLVR